MTQFNIQECTVSVYGAIKDIACAISSQLTKLEANFLIHPQITKIQPFINHINNMRKIHPARGQSNAIDMDITQEPEAQEAISKTEEVFGSLDKLVGLSAIRDFLSQTQNKRFQSFYFSRRRSPSMIYVFNSKSDSLDIMKLYRQLIKLKKTGMIFTTSCCCQIGLNSQRLLIDLSGLF